MPARTCVPVDPSWLAPVSAELHALRETLRKCLLLATDARARLAVLSGADRLLLDEPSHACRATLSAASFSASRSSPDGTPDGGLADLLSHPALLEVPLNASPHGRRADRLVLSLVDGERGAASDLLRWAPLIETTAYAAGAKLIQVLDGERDATRFAIRAGAPDARASAARYWTRVGLMARLTVLSTTAGSAGWLAGLGHSFPWTRWTPSFPLVRERTLSLAMIGARAAAAFGPSVAERYAHSLFRASSALSALDAILGLASLAIEHPSVGILVERALLDAAGGPLGMGDDDEALVRMAAAQALGEIARPSARADDRSMRIAASLRHPFAFVAGRCDAITHLRAGLSMPAARLLSAGADRCTPTADLAEAAFLRAWGAAGADRRTLH